METTHLTDGQADSCQPASRVPRAFLPRRLLSDSSAEKMAAVRLIYLVRGGLKVAQLSCTGYWDMMKKARERRGKRNQQVIEIGEMVSKGRGRGWCQRERGRGGRAPLILSLDRVDGFVSSFPGARSGLLFWVHESFEWQRADGAPARRHATGNGPAWSGRKEGGTGRVGGLEDKSGDACVAKSRSSSWDLVPVSGKGMCSGEEGKRKWRCGGNVTLE
ncbi:hypothetical protein IWZ00DRAFT_271104 [Phyllosticta capitalensis]